MKKQLLLMVLIIFMGCSSKSKTGDLIQANVTVFEIRGNGKQLNLPIFDEYVRVDEIESFVLEGEKVYESLADIYDFKDYTLQGRGIMRAEFYTGESSIKENSPLLGFELESVKLEILFESFHDNTVDFQIRFEKNGENRGLDVNYQEISVEVGQSVSIGTMVSTKSNTGVLVALSLNQMKIDGDSQIEDFFNVLKGNNYENKDLTSYEFNTVEEISVKYGLVELGENLSALRAKLKIPNIEYSGSVTLRPVTTDNKYYPKSAIKDSISGDVIIALDYNAIENDSRMSIVRGLREDIDRAAMEYLSSFDLTEIFHSIKPGFSMYEITIEFNYREIPEKKQATFIPYDTPPSPLSPIKPVYPEEMQESKIEGMVIVQVFIEADGSTGEMVVLREAHPDLNNAALEALRSVKWEPARQKDEPVGVWVSVPVNFKLETDKD